MPHSIACSQSATAAQPARLYMEEVAKFMEIFLLFIHAELRSLHQNSGKNYLGHSLGLSLYIIYRRRE